jgi:hypothetical protein
LTARGVLLPAGLLAVAIGLSPQVLLGQVFYERDLHLQWWAQMDVVARLVAQGSIPGWDPWTSFGVPILANPNNQVLYPPAWVSLVLDPARSATLLVLFHLAVAGLGAARLTRELGGSQRAAAVSGVVFMACGPLVSLVNLWNHLMAAAWLPWTWVAAVRGGGGDHRWLAAWATLLALPILTGSPDVMVMAVVVSGAALVGREELLTVRPGLRLGAALALALLLAAVQVVPAAVLLRDSDRRMDAAVREGWEVRPRALGQLLLPIYVRSAPPPEERAAFWGPREPYLRSIYLGLGASLLAAVALATRRTRVTWIALALAGMGVALALGPHLGLYRWVTALPPLDALRFPPKFMVLAALAWSVLAGQGAEALAGRPRLARGLVALAALDLLAAHTGLNRTAPRELYTWRPPAVDALRAAGAARTWVYDYEAVEDGGPRRLGRASAYRVPVRGFPAEMTWVAAAALRTYLLPPIGSAWGLRGGFDRDLLGLHAPAQRQLTDAFWLADGTAEQARLLREAGVTHVLSLHHPVAPGVREIQVLDSQFENPIRLLQVEGAWPRFFVAASPDGPPSTGARVVALREQADDLRLEVEGSGGFLVVNDVLRAGWVATVDGSLEEIVPARSMFRAVAVPPGAHRVGFTYRVPGLRAGAALTVLALLVLAWLWARPNGPSTPPPSR